SQIQAAEWRRANALAGRVVDRVGNSRRCGWPRRFAEPAPFRAAGRRKDRLDVRMLVDAEQVVGIEVGVDEAAAFQLEPAGPGMRELPADGAFALLGGGMRIDDATRIQHDQELLDVEPATTADRHRGTSPRDGAVRFNDRNTHPFALRQVGPETGLLFER